MIIELFFDLIAMMLHVVFLPLPNLPGFNNELLNSMTQFINLIFDNVGLLGFFIRIDTIKTIVPLLILVLNFDHIYHLVMWILRKIPFLNIN